MGAMIDAQPERHRPLHDHGRHAAAPQTATRPSPARNTGLRARILDDVLSIEASVILFVFAGRYKMLPEFQGSPVDLTLLFFILAVGLIAWGVMSRRVGPLALDAPNILMLAFTAFGVASVFWSSLEPKNVDKAWRFVLLGISSYFLVVVLAQDMARRQRLIRLMIGFSVALLLYYAFYRWVIGVDPNGMENAGRVNGNNYMEYGAHAAVLFYACLSLVVLGPRRRVPLAIGGAVVALFALLLIGARGYLMFALFSMVLAGGSLLISRRRFLTGTKRLLLLVTALVVLGWAGYMALIAVQGTSGASQQLYTLERIRLQMSNESTHSLDIRAEAQDLAFRQWLARPLVGWGMGEFRLQHSLDYPHNLSLEVLMETGLAGACLFFPVLIIGVVACIRMARDRRLDWIDMTIALLFLTEFISHTTVQGYLPDDRIYFAYIGLIMGWRWSMRRPTPEPGVRTDADADAPRRPMPVPVARPGAYRLR